jgi:hypothetical protein
MPGQSRTDRCQDTLRVGMPLVSRQLIRQVSISHALQSAKAADLPTAELVQPKPLYHVAGLALALSFMILVEVMLHDHWTALSHEAGVMLRSAVSA